MHKSWNILYINNNSNNYTCAKVMTLLRFPNTQSSIATTSFGIPYTIFVQESIAIIAYLIEFAGCNGRRSGKWRSRGPNWMIRSDVIRCQTGPHTIRRDYIYNKHEYINHTALTTEFNTILVRTVRPCIFKKKTAILILYVHRLPLDYLSLIFLCGVCPRRTEVCSIF